MKRGSERCEREVKEESGLQINIAQSAIDSKYDLLQPQQLNQSECYFINDSVIFY